MSIFWNNRCIRSILLTILVLYIFIGVVLMKNRTDESIIMATVKTTELTGKSGPDQEMKTVVSYSLDYQIENILRDTENCESDNESEIKIVRVRDDIAQLHHDVESNIFVVNVFLDERLKPYRFVRAIALVPYNASLYCQAWKKGSSKSFSRKAIINPIWSENWDKKRTIPYLPAIVSCVETEQPGDFISFSRNRCQKSLLRFAIRKPKKRQTKNLSFTVCLKPLNFQKDILRDLKEWLEINLTLGVDKFFVYYTDVNREVLKFLRKLNNNNFLELINFPDLHFKNNLTKDGKTWFRRKLEVLIYNDCFYKNLNFDFVIPLDLDEIIVPKNSTSLSGIFTNFYEESTRSEKYLKYKINKYSSYSVKNAFFFKNYPNNLLPNLVANGSIFDRKIRSLNFSKGSDSVKSLIYVPNTLSIFNHFAFEILRNSIRQVLLPISVAQLNHYRDTCDPRLTEDCSFFTDFSTIDISLERFRKNKKL